MLISLPKKHERLTNLTYTRTLPEIKVEMLKLKLLIFVENGNCFHTNLISHVSRFFLLIFKAWPSYTANDKRQAKKNFTVSGNKEYK